MHAVRSGAAATADAAYAAIDPAVAARHAGPTIAAAIGAIAAAVHALPVRQSAVPRDTRCAAHTLDGEVLVGRPRPRANLLRVRGVPRYFRVPLTTRPPSRPPVDLPAEAAAATADTLARAASGFLTSRLRVARTIRCLDRIATLDARDLDTGSRGSDAAVRGRGRWL